MLPLEIITNFFLNNIFCCWNYSQPTVFFIYSKRSEFLNLGLQRSLSSRRSLCDAWRGPRLHVAPAMRGPCLLVG